MPGIALVNGRVRTMDPQAPTAEGIFARGNRIKLVGSSEEVRARAEQDGALIIDVDGQTVLPGFNDCHMHPLSYGGSLRSVNLTSPPNSSIDDLLDNLSEWVEKTPEGEWIRGWGYDDTKLEEGRHPTRDDLDRVAPDHPVYFTRACGHVGVANSQALELAGVDAETPNPRGGHIDRGADGRPTGVLRETAQRLVRRCIPEQTREDMKETMRLVGQELARRGITSCWDAGVGREAAEVFGVYKELQHSDELPVRINLAVGAELLDELEALKLPFGFGDELLRISAVKIVLDGSVSGHTAALNEPFCDSDDTGLLYMPQDELDELVLRVHNLGLQAGIHAIGDRAVDSALTALENAVEEGTDNRARYRRKPADQSLFPGMAESYLTGPRHRIEHCTLTAPETIERLKRLGVLPVPQTIFMYGEGDSYLEYLGRARSERSYTLRSFLEAGIPVPLSSDAPATSWDDPLNPFLGIQEAVTRTTETGRSMGQKETISVQEALRAYTLHAAFASFDEAHKGLLRRGALADFIVLDSCPEELPAAELLSTQVVMTVMNGEVVYQAR